MNCRGHSAPFQQANRESSIPRAKFAPAWTSHGGKQERYGKVPIIGSRRPGNRIWNRLYGPPVDLGKTQCTRQNSANRAPLNHVFIHWTIPPTWNPNGHRFCTAGIEDVGLHLAAKRRRNTAWGFNPRYGQHHARFKLRRSAGGTSG